MRTGCPGILLAVALGVTCAGSGDAQGVFGFGEGGIELPYEATEVGSWICAECHDEHAEWQETHHMALTGRAVTPSSQDLWFSQQMLARPTQQPAGAIHPAPAYRATDEGVALEPGRGAGPGVGVDAVFGSGANGFTPVAIGPDHSLRELAISFVAGPGPGAWRPTPGQTGGPKALGVVVEPEEAQRCLGCHTTSLAWLATGIDPERSALGVQCERCHGPGSAHVDAVLDEDEDLHIYNPGALSPRQLVRFCGQCHRRALDLDPAQLTADAPGSARHAGASLMLSACFRKAPAAVAISCLDCHNPHRNIDDEARSFAAACRRCHASPAAAHTSVSLGPDADCVACHMPKVPGVAGIRFTNHWIRNPGPTPLAAEPGRHEVLAYLDSVYRSALPEDGRGPLIRADLHKRAAQTEVYLGRRAAAIEHYRQALALGPRYTARIEIAADYTRLGMRTEAVDALRAALAVEPGRRDAYSRLVGLYLDDGDAEGAERVLRRWSAAIPGDELLGRVLLSQGRADEAEAHFQRALEIDPGSEEAVRARVALGSLSRSRGDLDAAIQYFRQAVEVAPDFAEAHARLGQALAAGGDPAGGIQHLQRALEIDPGSGAAHADLGLLLAARGEADAAEAQLRQAVAADSALARAQLGLARLLDARGSSAAVAHYRAALEQQASPEVVGRLAWLLATVEDDSVRDGPEAVRLARQLAQHTRYQDPAILAILAAAFTEVGAAPSANAVARRGLGLLEADTTAAAAQLRQRLQGYTQAPRSP